MPSLTLAVSKFEATRIEHGRVCVWISDAYIHTHTMMRCICSAHRITQSQHCAQRTHTHNKLCFHRAAIRLLMPMPICRKSRRRPAIVAYARTVAGRSRSATERARVCVFCIMCTQYDWIESRLIVSSIYCWFHIGGLFNKNIVLVIPRYN